MRLSLILIVAMLVVSCAPKALTIGAKPNEINELQKIETFSYISFIEKGNRAVYNDTISRKASEMFSNILNSFRHKVPVTDDLETPDASTRSLLEREVEFLCISADKNRNLNALKITPALDALLESNNKRFGLITVTSGFTRRKGNYGGQVAKGVGIGILTLGLVMPTPIKANSTIYAAIVDAQENKVIYFHKSLLQEEPLDSVVISEQIERLFKGYFWQ